MKVRLKMGGSNSQVAGYKYFAGLMVALGNPIEKLININPDNRGWIFKTAPDGDQSVRINKPNLFGGDSAEGGWNGWIDIHTGRPEFARQNWYLARHDSELVSAYPYLSYLVYRGLTDDKGFHLVSMSGMMKEVLYRVKRTRIKNDGSEQWYKINEDGDLVCEIAQPIEFPPFVLTDTFGTQKYKSGGNPEQLTQVESVDYLLYKTNTVQNSVGGRHIGFGDSVDDGTELDTITACVSAGVVTENNGFINIYGTGSYLATSRLQATPYGNVECMNIETVITNQETIPNDGRVRRDFTWTATFKSNKASNEFGVIFYVSGPQVSEDGQRKDIALTVYMNVSRQTKYTGNSDSADINPIHKIREILTDDTAMNKAESDINDDNFKAAANRIWSEKLGISWAIQEKSCKEAIDELLYHIEAGIRVNRQTGQYEIVLFRDDLLNLEDAMQFDESNIKEFSREIVNQDDLINVLNVKYYDRENIKESSFNVYDNGNLMSNGNQEITEAVNFPYFMNRTNAELVANWKLKQLATPTWKGSFTTGKYEARKLNKYDVIKLSWINADFVDMPVRVMKIRLGDGRDNTVSIDWIEVIPYSALSYQPINFDPPTSVVLPAQPNVSKVFEMPYFEAVQNFGQTQVDAELASNPDLGYLMIASELPQNNSMNALLYTTTVVDYVRQGIINYCPTFVLDQDIGRLDYFFAVKNFVSSGSAPSATCIVIDDEIMVYVSYNVDTKILTVKRGALDTVPKPHLNNTKAFFYDAFPSFDSTQYVDGEVVFAKSLTTTPSSVLDIEEATTIGLEMNARAIRPYPPANIKINGNYYPDSVLLSNDIVLTWADRNRVQQTGGAILGWIDGSVTKETGVTYSLELSENGVVVLSVIDITATTYTIAKTIPIHNKTHKLKVWSVRDGYDSFQIFEHDFYAEAIEIDLTATAYKDHVTGTTATAASLNVVVDESLTANLKWDGSSISGKAAAGSTITIEVNP